MRWPVAMAALWAAGLLTGAEVASEPQRAVAQVIHLAADGSDILRGNGFLISGDGVVVTNYHVVVGAARLQVRLKNGDVYDQVMLKALDPAGDLAVLKIPTYQAPHLGLAGRNPAAGESVRLVGWDGVAEGSLRDVHVLAPDLEIATTRLTTDARSKGGPVLDSQGKCVGIAVLTYRPTDGGSALVLATRVPAMLRQELNWPVEQMDWRSWSVAEDPALRPALEKAGLQARLPDPSIRAEQDLARRLEMTLAFDPTDFPARALLGRAYMQRGEYVKAREQIDRVLAHEPDDPGILTLKGDLLVHTGEFDEARRLYKQVVDAGLRPPNNYVKNSEGIVSGDGFHDHAVAFCQGGMVVSAEEFSYQGGWNDAFTVRYDNIKVIIVRPMVWQGGTVHRLRMQFLTRVSNVSGTWRKEDFTLRVANDEVRQNLIQYLKQRGVAVAEREK